MKNTFCIRLNQLRKSAKLSMQKLGDDLSVAKSTIACWEIGRQTPNTDTMIKIADYFNVSLDYLFGRTDDPRPVDKYSIDDGQIVYIGNLPNDKKEIVKEIIKSFNKVD